jgi:hypothetical protein
VLTAHVYRLADLVNKSEYVLLPGEATMYEGAQGPQMAQTHKNQDHRRRRGCASEVVAGFEAYSLIESAIMMEMG